MIHKLKRLGMVKNIVNYQSERLREFQFQELVFLIINL